MNYRPVQKQCGFTIVELLIVIVVIGILATIGAVSYNGINRRAASGSTMSDLRSAQQTMASQQAFTHAKPTALPSDIHSTDSVTLTFVAGTSHYSGLSAVQNGVLFYTICKQLIADPQYSTIHAKSGGGTNSVVMSCDDSISAGGLQITGWDTKNWAVPVTQSAIQSYIDSVPYDSWWIDRQSVVRGFYSALISQFTASGGTWPITSFWDPWANQWSGVPKSDLPAPDSDGSDSYCIMAASVHFPDIIYHTVGSGGQIVSGAC